MIIILTLTLAGAGGIYYFVQSELETNIDIIKERTAELRTMDEKSRLLSDTREALVKLKAEAIVAKLGVVLPENKSQAEAIQNLYDIFNTNGITLEAITFDSTEEEPDEASQSAKTDINGVLTLPVELTFNSLMSYGRAKELIQDLQQSSRHISISTLQISPSGIEDRPNDVTIDLSVDIHFEGKNSAGTTGASKEDILKQIEEGASL